MSIESHRFNEYRLRVFGVEGRMIAFVCECDDPSCRRAVTLTRADVEALWGNGDPILAPGHVPVADAPLGIDATAIADDSVEPAPTDAGLAVDS